MSSHQRFPGRFLLIGFFIGICNWFIDSLVMIVVLGEGQFIDNVFSPDPDDIWMRTFSILSLTIFGGLVDKYVINFRQAKEALGESEARYREIFDESPVGIWEEDWSDIKRMLDDLVADGVTGLRRYFDDNPDKLGEAYDLGKVVNISRATYEMFRAPSKQALIGINNSELETIEVINGFRDNIIAFMAGENECAFESLDHRFDGTAMVISTRLVIPSQHRHDWTRVIYAIEDITDRKPAEEALRESEARFRQAAQLANLGHWSWDEVADRIDYVFGEIARIHGMT